MNMKVVGVYLVKAENVVERDCGGRLWWEENGARVCLLKPQMKGMLIRLYHRASHEVP